MARISFKGENAQIKEVNKENKVEVEVSNNVDFFTDSIMKDKVFEDFFKDPTTKKFLLMKFCSLDDVISIYGEEAILKRLQEKKNKPNKSA